jgi:hypothetical protein
MDAGNPPAKYCAGGFPRVPAFVWSRFPFQALELWVELKEPRRGDTGAVLDVSSGNSNSFDFVRPSRSRVSRRASSAPQPESHKRVAPAR